MVDHVRHHAGDAGVDAMLERAGLALELDRLLDASTWLTYDDKVALFSAAAETLGDPDVGRHVGETVLRGEIGQLVPVLRALGGPGPALRSIVDASDAFCPTADMRLLESGEHHAIVEYRLNDEHVPNRHDCAYTMGLLSQIGPVFGLAPASVVEQTCKADGAEACRFRISWAGATRPRRMARRARRDLVRRLTARFWELEATMPALLADAEPEVALRAMATRAAEAVGAVSHVLVLTDVDGTSRVTEHGLVGGTAALVDDVFQGMVDDSDGRRVVVPLESDRRRYGHLVLLFDDDAQLPEARAVVEAHARHVAVALDAVHAIRDARVREETASVLLGLARSLSELTTVSEVASRLAAAVPTITGAEQSAVMLLDRATKELRVEASFGVPEHLAADVNELVVPVDDSTLDLPMSAAERPTIVTRDEATGFMAEIMERHGEIGVALVPIRQRGHLQGMISCGWRTEVMGDRDALDARLAGLADQAATAIENAMLLEQVRHQALHDSLTDLPNQTLFADRVCNEIARATRNRTRVALGVLDLDRFKTVNDSLGHGAGDQLLIQVTDRLLQAMRAPDTVARMGGDEFTLLLPDVGDNGEGIVADRILEAFVQPFEVEGHRLRISPSIGLAVFPDDGDTFEQLLKCADVAMYRAKDRGRNTWASYASGMAERAYDRLTLEADLYRALQRRELRVAYQPIARLHDGSVVGSEALVRWAHPTLGLLVPDDFLSIAEDLGLMAEIDGWVLRQACLELGASTAGGRGVDRISVNLSARTLLHPALERLVAEALAAGGLDASRLVVEVNEAVTADETHAVADALRSLRAQGVRVSLDDFGRGHSALGRLEQLPIDQLKVDAIFLSNVDDPMSSAPVVEAIVAMGRGLGLEVVAEGVETDAHRRFVERVGFDLAQGWFLGRPTAELVLCQDGARSRTA